MRYGYLYTSSSNFSRQCDSWDFITSNFHYVFRLQFFLFLDSLPLLCHLNLLSISVVQEFYTCCPSATPFGLTLGPDLPWADEPSPGNLRLSTAWILTMLSLLIPAFSLLSRPHILSVMLHPTAECSSTTAIHLKMYMNSSHIFKKLILFCLRQMMIALYFLFFLLTFPHSYIFLNIPQSAISVYSLAPVIFRATSLDQ